MPDFSRYGQRHSWRPALEQALSMDLQLATEAEASCRCADPDSCWAAPNGSRARSRPGAERKTLMGTTTYKDQKLLILVTPPDANLLAEQGEAAEREGTEAFHLSMSHGEHGYFAIPTAAGFHVWEGEIECFPDDSGPGGNTPQEPAIAWHGDWRPATTGDLQRFGIPMPLAPPVTLQKLLDVGLNAFAVQLLVESYRKHSRPIPVSFELSGVRVSLELKS